MQAGIVQRIFNDHFEEYQRNTRLHSREAGAAHAIMTCKIPAQGFHIDACPNGDYQAIVFNSCKHRACPQCGATETQLWLERRKAQALDCPYFHVIFTISHDLHVIWRFNRKTFTNLMMQAAWHSLRELLWDWRHLGGLPGAVGVFQSWDDEMQEHCHLHFIGHRQADLIQTAGGSAQVNFCCRPRFWRPSSAANSWPICGRAFQRIPQRGKAKPPQQILQPPSGMSIQQCLNLLNKLGRQRWHADIEPPYEHPNGVFKYVGRYIRRGRFPNGGLSVMTASMSPSDTLIGKNTISPHSACRHWSLSDGFSYMSRKREPIG